MMKIASQIRMLFLSTLGASLLWLLIVPSTFAQEQHLSIKEGEKLALDFAKGAASGDTEKVIDVTISTMMIAYPPAGIVLGAAKGLLSMMGAFNSPDLVAEAIKVIDQRLKALEAIVTNLQGQVSEIRNEGFRTQNRERLRELLHFNDDMKRLALDLKQQPTDQAEKDKLAGYAQVIADRFLSTSDPDADLWNWNGLRVYTDRTTGDLKEVLLPASFKPLPTLEYYFSALLLWIAAIEYSDREATYVQQAYGPSLLKHAAWLKLRLGWDDHDDAQQPLTLPENVTKRVFCYFGGMSRYPKDNRCYVGPTLCRDDLSHRILPMDDTIHDFYQKDKIPKQFCNPPAWFGGPWGAEVSLEESYGVKPMALMAASLERLANTGTTSQMSLGFGPIRVFDTSWLYAVKPNGDLLHYRHEMTQGQRPKLATPIIPELSLEAWDSRPELSPETRYNRPALIPIDLLAKMLKNAHTTTVERVFPVISPDDFIIDDNILDGHVIDGVFDDHITNLDDYIIVDPFPMPDITHEMWDPRNVGSGWQTFLHVIPGGANSFYALTSDGVLKWYRHDGSHDGTPIWQGPVNAGSGWESFTKILPGADGVLYGIDADGVLQWYRDKGYLTGVSDWEGPKEVGTGWGNFVHVFSTGEGIIYGVTPDGRLLWYKHEGFLEGTPNWEGPLQVGTGWAQFKHIFSTKNGMIYAVQPSGELLWYVHKGYKEGQKVWLGPVEVGAGWNTFVHVFPLMQGIPKYPVVH